MPAPLLLTKLYIPPPRPKIVLRPRLIERLNEGLQCKLILISAPAGFGKTTMVSDWIPGCRRPVAWLSLDKGDSDLTRFLMYFIAALQTVEVNIGKGELRILESPQRPSIELILTALLNEIATILDDFILVLDDYHVIDSQLVDDALGFLLEHLPPQLHLVITTREDPSLPLARLRARGQLIELRAADLRFTPAETADFLNQSMRLNVSTEDIYALETRTEGWIAGLQMAAISMRGVSDVSNFIQSFAGSHRFVLDYLVEEVLHRQPIEVQAFLLRTSILERLCGSLCDAVLDSPSASGQETLEYLEHVNLFIVSLDNERRWYRYHHLFVELLRQRLQQGFASSEGGEGMSVVELHSRASLWCEDHDLDIEAFQYAAAAGEVDHAIRLIEGKGIPLYHRGALVLVLNWLKSLPKSELDKRPVLWLMYARVLTSSGQASGVEEKLQAAEKALHSAELSLENRDLIGSIASNRATMAYTRYDPDMVIIQAQRALKYLSPDNLPTRTLTTFTLGVGYMQNGDRTAATHAFTDAISISQKTGHTFVTSIATMALGNMQIMENKLYAAAETHRQALQLFGTQPLPISCESHLGLAQIYYEWNDLNTAEQHGLQALQLARQFEKVIDRYIICEVFLARLKLAQGDLTGAAAILAETEQAVLQNNFVHRIPDVAAQQVIVLLHQGNLMAAAQLAQAHALPISQARVYLALGDLPAALALLSPLRQQMEAKDWQDERLKVMVLQAVALHAHGEKEKAIQLLSETLTLAEPGGFIRLFKDEGIPMAQLLQEAASHGVIPAYTGKLLSAFDTVQQKSEDKPAQPLTRLLIEPLSQRELKVLQLIAQGLTNREIGERLFLALDTVKGYNRKIFDKLQVQSRTEAVARARVLGLL